MAVTYSGGTLKDGTKLYVDGASKLTQDAAGGTTLPWTSTPNTSTGNMAIGKRVVDSAGKYYGSIDEVRIYSAALPSSAIREQYVAGLDKLLAGNQITQKDYQKRIAELNSTYATNE